MVTRRQVLQAALTVAAAPLARGSEDIVYLYNWNNYMTERTARRFQAECGCTLVQDFFADNEELLAKLAAGASGYDVLVPTGNAVEALLRQGVLRHFQKKLLPNLKNIKAEFMGSWFDPQNEYSVPYAYSITLIGFQSARLRGLDIPTDSWAAIFEPRHLAKIKNKVTVLDSQRELMAAALMYLGHSPNDADPRHWQDARELILGAKPYWAAFNAASYSKELATGAIWLAHGYSNDIYIAQQDALKAERNFTIQFATPKEGAVFALDNLVLHRSGRRPDLAHRLVNFLLEPDSAAELTNETGSGSPNAAAVAYIKPELAANTTLFPDRKSFARLHQLHDLDRKQRRLLNRIWIEIKVR